MKILTAKRPFGGSGERMVADEILSQLPDLMVYKDEKGQPMAYVYTTDEKSKTLFVSHLDTVHRKDGYNPVIFDEALGIMYKKDGECLGADDGAGVWVTYEMARHGVKGTFIWTVGEEKGGVGAKWLADHASVYLSSFDRAVSFDRRGTDSVITHQGWNGRCCSNDFAEELSVRLTALFKDNAWAPDSGGVYTDTAEFVTIIPECTNVSCGYLHEHGGDETLDVEFLKELRDACIALDWESLPTTRDPKEIDYDYGLEGWGGYGSIKYNKYTKQDRKFGAGSVPTLSEFVNMDDYDIQDLVYEDPELATELLISLKYDMMFKEDV